MSGHDAVFRTDWTRELPTVVRGEGISLFAEEGTRYIDAASGVKVASLGHGLKEIAEAMSAQAQQLGFAYAGAFRRGLFINVGSSDMVEGAGGDNVGLAPPLVITAAEIDRIVEILGEAIAVAERGFLDGQPRGTSHG